MFIVVEVLLYDAIPSNEFETFYNEANANECKRIPNMGGSRMCMFGWNMYKSSVVTYGRIKLMFIFQVYFVFSLFTIVM